MNMMTEKGGREWGEIDRDEEMKKADSPAPNSKILTSLAIRFSSSFKRRSIRVECLNCSPPKSPV